MLPLLSLPYTLIAAAAAAAAAAASTTTTTTTTTSPRGLYYYYSHHLLLLLLLVPVGSPSRGRDVAVYVLTTELAQSFFFRSYVCFSLYGPFNYILFHSLSRQLSAFSLCSSGLIFALLVL